MIQAQKLQVLGNTGVMLELKSRYRTSYRYRRVPTGTAVDGRSRSSYRYSGILRLYYRSTCSTTGTVLATGSTGAVVAVRVVQCSCIAV